MRTITIEERLELICNHLTRADMHLNSVAEEMGSYILSDAQCCVHSALIVAEALKNDPMFRGHGQVVARTFRRASALPPSASRYASEVSESVTHSSGTLSRRAESPDR